MAKAPKISSDFALLDIKRGRKRLFQAVGYHGSTVEIPVTIKGRIAYAWGGDDGESREFCVMVDSVETELPLPARRKRRR